MIRETSQEVWQAINEEGLVGALQAEVMRTVVASGSNMTMAEIAQTLGTPKNHISGRCSELVRSGLLKEAGKRKCNVTGRTVLTFRELKEGEAKTCKLGKCGIDVDVDAGKCFVVWDGKVDSEHRMFAAAEAKFKELYKNYKKLVV